MKHNLYLHMSSVLVKVWPEYHMLQYHLKASFQNENSWGTPQTYTKISGIVPTRLRLYQVPQMTHMHTEVSYKKKRLDFIFPSFLCTQDGRSLTNDIDQASEL